ncbi:MAG: heme NO-binding domain-containing protein [Magnetococcales bacterium]|nr:heme NO-binding domain-containing protein [Magnetococcales bacterium]MBF0155574.1 heme NO-binding domain-containing protein [Magnetococcales bacterium]
MHGIIFLALQDFLEERLGPDTWPRVLAASDLFEREYFSDGTYPDAEAESILNSGAMALSISREDLLFQLGEHMSPGLLEMGHSVGLVRDGWTSMDILENLRNIFEGFVSLNPGMSFPDIRTLRIKHGEVALAYMSKRRMCSLIKGIVQGMGHHFSQPIAHTEPVCMLREAHLCRMSFYLNDPSLLRYVDIQREFGLIHERIQEISFFNQFKGISISNKGLVLRFTKEEVLVQVNRDQLMAMKLEGGTYIDAPHLRLGLEAKVKEVDFRQGTVVLHRITLADGALGQREHSRIEPGEPIEVDLQVEGRPYHGTLLNLSPGGVSITLDDSTGLDEMMLFAHAWVRFAIPLKWVETGDTLELGPPHIEIDGNLLNVGTLGNSSGVARILFAKLSPRDQNMIEQYMNKRHDEVIPELKAMVAAAQAT